MRLNEAERNRRTVALKDEPLKVGSSSILLSVVTLQRRAMTCVALMSTNMLLQGSKAPDGSRLHFVLEITSVVSHRFDQRSGRNSQVLKAAKSRDRPR